MTCRTLFVFCCLFPYVFSAKSEEPAQEIIINGPQNDAIEWGPSVLLTCQASGTGVQVEWREYITNRDDGGAISINDQLLNHPNSDRYSIIYDPDTLNYNLQINGTVLTDGGTYRCTDTTSASSYAYAQLIMLDGTPLCTSNIPADGSVIEGVYYTIECSINYRGNAAPIMTWEGPEEWRGSWGQAITTTNTTVWSGVNMNMSRFFDGQTFEVLANFTERGLILPSSATNVPTWNYTTTFVPFHVNWKPGAMYTIPDQTVFEIGSTILCESDGYPAPTYFWQNGATNQIFNSQEVTFTADMIGTATWRCNAQNDYGSNDLSVQITVTAPTTPTTPTTTSTAAPPPAEGPCSDLTGRWGSTVPSVVDLCLEIDNDNNGQIIGLFRNATDPYFIEIRGRVQPDKFDEVGFVGIWPVNIGTQAFTGVCTSCFGEESLQISAVARVIGDFNTCSDFGQLRLFSTYQFTRTGPPCRGLFKEYGLKV